MNTHPDLSILHIASGDLWAGAEVQLYTLAKTLHKIPNVSVSVLLFNPGMLADKLSAEGIQVTILDESLLNGFKLLAETIRILKSSKIDIIHTHRTKENIIGGISGRLAGNIPSIRTAHGAPEHHHSILNIPKHTIRLLNYISGRYLQRRIIAVSDDLANHLQHTFPDRLINVIENGIDQTSLPVHTNRSDTINHHADGYLHIGIAGRLVPVKRVDLFIQTARHILDQYPTIKAQFHIYGDGPERNSLEQLSKRLGAENIVRFEGHTVDLPGKLQDLDMLLMTSDHEGLPMTLLEAMATATPIIAHATGGIPNLLDHGNCGLLADTQDASSYAEKIYLLAGSDSLRSNITNKALERVRNNYSAKRNAESYLLIYSEIAKTTLK